MTIGIDASRALRPIKTGTEWYSVEIIRHLVVLDTKNNYILYSNKPPEAPLLDLEPQYNSLSGKGLSFREDAKHVTWRVMPFSRGWTLLRLSWEMRKNPPDILFIPAHTLPLIHPKKSIVMIHDLGFRHNPELYPLRQKLYHNFVINFVTKHASHILTPSEFVKQDIIKTFHYPAEKITAIHHGYDQNLYQPRHPANHPTLQHQPYIFYIGRLETKKNIIGLLEAFRLLRTQSTILSTDSSKKGTLISETKIPPVKLVLAGKPSHGYDQIRQKIDSLGELKKDVIELGYVPEEEVPTWLSNAALFSFATLFEGFGIPVIQAMACGTPVVASNVTSLPEIAGDAALLVDPHNPQLIAQAFAQILTDSDLKADLINKGYKRAQEFTWQKTAGRTLEAIQKVINE